MKSKTCVTQPFRMSLTLATAPQTLHGREKTLQGEASATSNSFNTILVSKYGSEALQYSKRHA